MALGVNAGCKQTGCSGGQGGGPGRDKKKTVCSSNEKRQKVVRVKSNVCERRGSDGGYCRSLSERDKDQSGGEVSEGEAKVEVREGGRSGDERCDDSLSDMSIPVAASSSSPFLDGTHHLQHQQGPPFLTDREDTSSIASSKRFFPPLPPAPPLTPDIQSSSSSLSSPHPTQHPSLHSAFHWPLSGSPLPPSSSSSSPTVNYNGLRRSPACDAQDITSTRSSCQLPPSSYPTQQPQQQDEFRTSEAPSFEQSPPQPPGPPRPIPLHLAVPGARTSDLVGVESSGRELDSEAQTQNEVSNEEEENSQRDRRRIEAEDEALGDGDKRMEGEGEGEETIPHAAGNASSSILSPVSGNGRYVGGPSSEWSTTRPAHQLNHTEEAASLFPQQQHHQPFDQRQLHLYHHQQQQQQLSMSEIPTDSPASSGLGPQQHHHGANMYNNPQGEVPHVMHGGPAGGGGGEGGAEFDGGRSSSGGFFNHWVPTPFGTPGIGRSDLLLPIFNITQLHIKTP